MAFTIGDIVANAFDSNTPNLGSKEISKTSTVATEAIVETPKVSNDAPIIVEEAKVEVLPSVNGIPVLDLKPVNGSANYTELNIQPLQTIPSSHAEYLSNYVKFDMGVTTDFWDSYKNAIEILCLRLQTEKNVFEAFKKFINSFNPNADRNKRMAITKVEKDSVELSYSGDNGHKYSIVVEGTSTINLVRDSNGVVVRCANPIHFYY